MTSGHVIADSSPLIGLERIGRLDVLPALFGTVVVPPAVARETARNTALPAWIVECPLPGPLDVRVARTTLGIGEREAIGLALLIRVERVLLDDEPARGLALGLGLPVTGTLGVLVLAKRAGIIDAIRPLVDALVAVDFRIEARLRARVLATVGEPE